MNNFWPDDGAVQRYLLGKLTEQELDDFEACMLGDPEFLTYVRAEASLLEGAKDVGACKWQAPPSNSPAPAGSRPRIGTLPGRLQRVISSPPWAWSASALAAVACIALVNTPKASPPELIDTIIYVAQTRSSEELTVTVNAGESTLLAIDAIAWEQSGVVNVTLTGAGTSLTFASAPIGQDFEVYVPVTGLQTGSYTLVLSGSGIERRYAITAR